MKTLDLKATEYNEYYKRYINLISKEIKLLDGFDKIVIWFCNSFNPFQ